MTTYSLNPNETITGGQGADSITLSGNDTVIGFVGVLIAGVE